MNNEAFVIKNTCFVGFMDVLGYRSIVEDTIKEHRKMKRLYSLFENLGIAIEQAFSDDEHTEVSAVSFSDSYYFSSKNLIQLLSFFEKVFATVYSFQESSYNKDSDHWVPFVRAGIVEDWAVSFRDPTLKKLQDTDVFRNPVGPAVAKSYILTEKRGRLPGMRCFLEHDLFDRCSPTRVAEPPHYKITFGNRTLRFFDVPDRNACEKDLKLVELAWPCRVISSSNCSFYRPLTKCKEQFLLGSETDQYRRDSHYNAIVDLFSRSVDVCGDHSAVAAWQRERSNLVLHTGLE